MNKKGLLLGLLLPLFIIGCSTNDDSGLSSNNVSSSSEDSSTTSSSENSSSTSSESSSSSSSSGQSGVISDYVLYGQFNGSSNWEEISMTRNTGASSTEYMLLNITLYKDDVFKIHMSGAKYYVFNDVKSSSSLTSLEPGPNGLIKIKESGQYDIYSSYQYSDSGYVYISKRIINVDSVSLSNTGKFMKINTNYTLVATVLPSNATNKNVTWSTSNSSIATVDRNTGKVSGVSAGKCTITATSEEDENKTASCVVFVSDTEVPMFYLFGTVGGQSILYGEYTYPAIIDTTNVYYFYDVEVYPGDEISIYDNTGHYKTDYYDSSKPYVFDDITEHKKVTFRFDVLNYHHNYLSIVQ